MENAIESAVPSASPSALPSTPTRTIGEMLADLRAAMDEKDEINDKLKKTNKRIEETEFSILAALRESGQTKASIDTISVAVGESVRVDYDPEKFEAIQKWLVDNGYGYVFHRRFSDTKVQEMSQNGIRLPDGLKLETFPKLSHRRNG